MSWTSGSLASTERAMVWSRVVVPERGGAGQQDPAALADRREQIEGPGVRRSASSSTARSKALGREGGGELLEQRPLGPRLELDIVHRVDPQDGRVLLVAERRAGPAGDDVALAEPELADLLTET